METINKKIQRVLQANGVTENQYKYVRSTADNIVFRHSKTGRLVDFRY